MADSPPPPSQKKKRSTFVRRGGKGKTKAAPGGATAVPAAPTAGLRGTRSGATSTPTLLTSSGAAEVDYVLGGGIPLGSVVAIGADRVTSYASVLVRLMAAEGLACGHAIGLAGYGLGAVTDAVPQVSTESGKGKPKRAKAKATDGGAGGGGRADLRIAWQYEKYLEDEASEIGRAALRNTRSSSLLEYCHKFDVGTAVARDVVEDALVVGLDLAGADGGDDAYPAVLARLSEAVAAEAARDEPRVLRLALLGLCSPVRRTMSPSDCRAFLRFLIGLRALVRDKAVVAYVTVSPHLHGAAFVRHVFHRCDAAIQLLSFAGHPDLAAAATFKEQHGLFLVHKAPALRALRGMRLETRTYTFKLRRRNFVVEKLHIPPDDGSGGEADAAVTETGAPSATQDGQLAQLLCAPGKSDLDF